MAQHISPGKTTVRIVPQEGELEITVNINITLDGQVVTTVNDPGVAIQEKREKSQKESSFLMPDFSSGAKLNFGKVEEK